MLAPLFRLYHPIHTACGRTHILIGLMKEAICMIELDAFRMVECIHSDKLAARLAILRKCISHKVYYGRADALASIRDRGSKMPNIYSGI